jgi:hypothetical protein
MIPFFSYKNKKKKKKKMKVKSESNRIDWIQYHFQKLAI